jgi:hypothetical protein
MKTPLLIILIFANYFFAEGQNGYYHATGNFLSSRFPSFNLFKTISRIDSNTFQVDVADLATSNFSFRFDIDRK